MLISLKVGLFVYCICVPCIFSVYAILKLHCAISKLLNCVPVYKMCKTVYIFRLIILVSINFIMWVHYLHENYFATENAENTQSLIDDVFSFALQYSHHHLLKSIFLLTAYLKNHALIFHWNWQCTCKPFYADISAFFKQARWDLHDVEFGYGIVTKLYGTVCGNSATYSVMNDDVKEFLYIIMLQGKLDYALSLILRYHLQRYCYWLLWILSMSSLIVCFENVVLIFHHNWQT